MAQVAQPGSFRDPSGRVFIKNGGVFRTVSAYAREAYQLVRASGLLEDLARRGWLVESVEVDPAVLGASARDAPYLLEHPAIPYVSFPYEWCFPALKAAALLHLDLHLEALERNVTLSDASAYNVQFLGPRPVFIDVLSLRPYREGEIWVGHRQFCEQFLNPLLLRAKLGVPHNAWYRGSLEGIATTELARLLPLRAKLSWNVFAHVILHARLHAKALKKPSESTEKARAGRLSRAGLQGLLRQLCRWIARLEPADRGASLWGDYTSTHSYSTAEESAKRRLVAEFVERTRPRLLLDLGCNTGDYAALALESGAQRVIGFDFDQGALETAFARAEARGLDFLPLFLDAANPSPDQGWRQAERSGFAGRAKADGLLALAFEHHLAIGRNVPLDQAIAWITAQAPRGVIEFVPKDDPTVRRMLAPREDIFPDYHETAFERCLTEHARIVRSEVISEHGRRLFWYERGG